MPTIRKAVFLSLSTHTRLKKNAKKDKRTLSAEVDYLLDQQKAWTTKK